MGTVVESKVSGIIKSLNELEGDLDLLNAKVTDMKKQLSVKALNRVDAMLEKTKELATREAETIINTAKEQAASESTQIEQKGQAKLVEIQSSIDANFDKAVKHVVSTILKE